MIEFKAAASALGFSKYKDVRQVPLLVFLQAFGKMCVSFLVVSLIQMLPGMLVCKTNNLLIEFYVNFQQEGLLRSQPNRTSAADYINTYRLLAGAVLYRCPFSSRAG